MEHKLHQEANDWVTCKCGELFKNSKKLRITKYEKLRRHLDRENKDAN